MAKRSGSGQRTPDAIKLLKDDHSEVSTLFDKYERAHKRLSESEKQALAQQICEALKVHAQIEEEIFYPACMEHVKGAEELLAEAKVEHESAKELISKIENETPGGEDYDAQVAVLGEYIRHHVKEEQNELFPKVRKSDMDLKDLGRQLAERKSSLMNGGRSSMAAE